MGAEARHELYSIDGPVTTDQIRNGEVLSHERRAQARYRTQFRSIFSGKSKEGQGRTLDLSLGGCKVESEMKIELGEKVELRLYLPGLDWPLRIEEAVVRWADGNIFGCAFTLVRPQELEKLQSVLDELAHGELEPDH